MHPMTRSELEDPILGSTVLTFQSFVAFVVDIVKRDNLSCASVFANSLLTYFVDIINYHISRDTSAASSSKNPIVYKLTLKQLSQVVIQKCLDMIGVLLRCSDQCATAPDLWASIFATNNCVPLDSLFFLKYFCIDYPALKNSLEAVAVEIWGQKDRISLSTSNVFLYNPF